MKPLTAAITLLSSALFVSAAPSTNPGGPIQTTTVSTCTSTIIIQPPRQTDCTFKASTKTVTEKIDCSGCALTTEEPGLGLPCQTEHTVPGVATVTVTSCKPSSTCTKTAVERIPFQSIAGGVCTTWKSTHTVPAYTDCTGCALKLVNEGAGPVVKCSTTKTEPVRTVTAPVCSSTS